MFTKKIAWVFALFTAFTGCRDGSSNAAPEGVTLQASLTSVNPYTFSFNATGGDADGDPLTYSWDFGDGTFVPGTANETKSFDPEQQLVIKVQVTDGKSQPIEARTSISTVTVAIDVDPQQTYQSITGFGGFGTQGVPWGPGPFTSASFVNLLAEDMGVTIIRDELPTNFEYVNDNDDPMVTDLSAYNITTDYSGTHRHLGTRLDYYRDMKAAGVNTFIVSVWSPPSWMKTNNALTNGTNQNSAPAYNPSPTAANNQLRTDMYEEFAEMCVAFVKIVKQETDVDIYALSIQNEPRFSQSYQSCLYNGTALRDLLKVVGRRFKDEGLTTKLFIPEDIGFLQGVEGMVKPTLDDPDARQYADIIAVHGYDLDGITANSPDAQTWNTMYGWGAAYGKPLWMTETSGYANSWDGAKRLANGIYTALKHGKVSAWVFWTLANTSLDEYCLVTGNGQKSKGFYTSKNFYRFIRPGAISIDAESSDARVVSVAFRHDTDQTMTVVLINQSDEDVPVKINGAGLPETFVPYVSSATLNCEEQSPVQSSSALIFPANSVMTLYGLQ